MDIYLNAVILIVTTATCYAWLKYQNLNQSYKKLEHENLELEKKSQQKSQFLANMSHEIRTPLNGIIVAGEILKEQELTPKTQEITDIINSSSKLVMNIINEILDFSKIEAGKLELDYQNFSLKNCIRDVVFAFEEQFKAKGLYLITKIDDDIEDKIYSDEMRLKQILYNIVGNSFKFTKAGGVNINISKQGDFLEFVIMDSGVGIAAENLPHIFTPYKQETKKTQKEFGGTGLGLSISKNLVEQLGGEIKVKSILGKGTQFIFTFKIEKVVDQLQPHQEARETHNLDFSSLSVLVADDNATNRKVVELSLAKYQVQLDFAVNGEEAAKKALSKQYDLILMDIQMPIMNGIEASEKIVTSIPFDKLPIIYALSADVFKETKDDCFNAGMSGFLGKPINLKLLKDPLKLALDRKNQAKKVA